MGECDHRIVPNVQHQIKCTISNQKEKQLKKQKKSYKSKRAEKHAKKHKNKEKRLKAKAKKLTLQLERKKKHVKQRKPPERRPNKTYIYKQIHKAKYTTSAVVSDVIERVAVTDSSPRRSTSIKCWFADRVRMLPCIFRAPGIGHNQ